MKIHQVRLQNWRGVEDQTVAFSPVGVTVVTGPNEVGKSSLIEALDLLFDEPDSSAKAAVKAVKPVHKDVGAEVEAEVEVGQWRFVYKKRFHKRALTELRILAPKAESLTGRVAHERVEQILTKELDVPLWKALRIAQSPDRGELELGDSRWLKSALDRAAGGAAVNDPKVESLHKAVTEERGRWFTDTGKPKNALSEALTLEQTKMAEVGVLRARLAGIDEDLQREERLRKDLVNVSTDLAKEQTRAAEHNKMMAEIGKLRMAHEHAKTSLANAKTALQTANSALDMRKEIERALEDASKEVGQTVEKLDSAKPLRQAAVGLFEEARLAAATAENVAEKAQRDAAQAAKDYDYRRAELDRDQLQDRCKRVQQIDSEIAAAEAVIERVRVTGPVLASLRVLQEEQVRAEARLAAASTEVVLQALAGCTPLVKGQAVPMATDATHEVRTSEPLTIEVPGLLRIQVRSGDGVQAPRKELDEKARALREELFAHGVESLDSAEAAHGDLIEAKGKVRAGKTARGEALRDLTLEQMLQKSERSSALVAGFLKTRNSDSPLPATLDEAKACSENADRVAKDAVLAAKSARNVRDTRGSDAAQIQGDFGKAEERLSLQQDRQARCKDAVAAAEAVASKTVLEEAVRMATGKRDDAAQAEHDAEEALTALQPELVEELLSKAVDLVKELTQSKNDKTIEFTRVQERLTNGSDEGLAEKLGVAEAAAEAARQDAESKRVRSEAAKLLCDVMDAQRDAEQARYVAPFQEKVQSLSRTVFGDGCSVQISDNLEIESRTLDGRTVPFDSLSGGAKEQLGIIARLACAILAASEGGVPVVLDDAFGWSDPDRVERLGALLGVAGRTCQVVLLTCDPGRGLGIAGAKVVTLG